MGSGWTFQELIGARMVVTANCYDCHHRHDLDLAGLRDRFGPDAPAMEWDLKPKLKCSRCGGNKVGLIYTPDTSPSAYREAKDGALEGRP